MEYFKRIYLLIGIALLGLVGCNSDNDASFQILVTQFTPTKDKVVLRWQIQRPNNMIIQDLEVLRLDTNNDEQLPPQYVRIANLPSNEITYTDNDVPYKAQVTYVIRLRYTVDNNNQMALSVPQTYTRQVVTFSQPPLQVTKDPVNSAIFHILDQTDTGFLKRYDANTNSVTQTKTLATGFNLNANFQIINNNEIFAFDNAGKVTRLDTQDYHTNTAYNVQLTDVCKAFAVDGDRIYYQDDEVWKYYHIPSGQSTNTGLAFSVSAAEMLGNHLFLFLYAHYGNSGFSLRGITPQNCNEINCWPDFYPVGSGTMFPQYSVDPHVFAWHPSRQKFASGYKGFVTRITDGQQEVSLNELTGKRYIGFTYDTDGNLYAAVQGEKIIQKFDANYQLLETIPTKLYPIFPMVNGSHLSAVGSYEPADYWGYYYGYEFRFDVSCAVETF